jgi:hypothetical protein
MLKKRVETLLTIAEIRGDVSPVFPAVQTQKLCVSAPLREKLQKQRPQKEAVMP